MKFIKILLIFFVLNSCKKNDVKDIEIEVFRFDKELLSVDSVNIDSKIDEWNATLNNFHHYYYSDFLDQNYENSDSLKNLILEGVYHQEIRLVSEEISNEFQDFTDIENEIESVFGIVQFYFPEMVIPRYVVTINGERTYNITFTGEGDTVILALDMYLGESNRAYNSAPIYLKNMFQRKYISSDILENWCNVQFRSQFQLSDFLDVLIYKGKIMYLMSKCMPNYDFETIFRFSKEEYEDCEYNEPLVWNEIKKQDYLYSTDLQKFRSYFNISNNTIGFDKSPGRLGYFIGYKIIDSYMKENDISLQELMKNTNSQEILLQSKYNPKKQDQESWFKKYWWIIVGLIFILGYYIYNKYAMKRKSYTI